MARARSRCSLRHKPPQGDEDEPVGSLLGAPIKDSNTLTPFSPVSQAQTPALTSAPPPVPSSTEELCQ